MRKSPLFTDFYELTMACAYFQSHKKDDHAVFELFYRKNPFGGEFCVVAGHDEIKEALDNYHFTPEEILYLKSHPAFTHADPAFFTMLEELHLDDIEIYGFPEGSIVFHHEPLLQVRGPLIKVQLLESMLLNHLNFASLIATLSRRIWLVAEGKTLVEFGMRRAQGPNGAVTRSFYSAKAITKSEDKKVLARNEQGTYFWSYESDNGTTAKFKDAVGLFHRDLGLKAKFNPTVETKEKLGFIRLEAKVEIPESYTQKLRAQFATSNKAINTIEMNATNMIHDYIDQGDTDELCRREEDDVYDSVDACKRRLISESRRAINTIRTTLGTLHNNKTAKEYTYNYALLGKELVRNQFVLNSFFSLDDSCEVEFEVKLDGHRINKMVKKIPANVNCR